MAGTGTFLHDVRLHANSMAGLEEVGVPNRGKMTALFRPLTDPSLVQTAFIASGRVATWKHFSLGILVSLANARNFFVTESYLYSEFQVFDTECSLPVSEAAAVAVYTRLSCVLPRTIHVECALDSRLRIANLSRVGTIRC